MRVALRYFAPFVRAACVLLCVGTLASCKQSVDLDAIQKLAASTAAAGDSYSALSNELYASCVREYEWEWAGALSHRDFPHLSDVCHANRVAADQWQTANLVVLSYVRALGSLAGGDDTQTDYGIPHLVDAINSATGSSLDQDKQLKPITSLSTSIAKDIFNIRRRNEIAVYAPQADKDLSALIAVLEDVASTNYSKQLDLETDAINNFYKSVVPLSVEGKLPAARPRMHKDDLVSSRIVNQTLLNVDRVQLLTLRDRYRTDRDAVDTRRGSIDAYVQSLEAIKGAHSALVASIQANDVGSVRRIVQAYIDQLRPDIERLRHSTNEGPTK